MSTLCLLDTDIFMGLFDCEYCIPSRQKKKKKILCLNYNFQMTHFNLAPVFLKNVMVTRK